MPSKLPEELAIAQAAIELPEVQDMIRRLSAYNLGVCMPHMHDEKNGFQVLPEGTVQVEDRLKVSFQTGQPSQDEYYTVAWRWAKNSATGVEGIAGCKVCYKVHH